MRNALVTQDLSVSFSGFKAVDGVSLSIAEGELRVLLGANGAGKTTMMDMISGRTASTSGKVLLYGENITNWDEHHIARAGIGRKFQIPTIFKDLTVRENLEVASCRGLGVISNLKFRFSAAQSERVDEVLDLVGLRQSQQSIATNLSHGETQWLELGLLIVQDPKVLLLDEPTAGMTQAETSKTARIVNDLRGRHTIVVVEHDMAFVREIAERIIVMHLGRIMAEGSLQEVESDPRVREAYLGSGGIR
jgi:urea transport system ATP-binding protein